MIHKQRASVIMGEGKAKLVIIAGHPRSGTTMLTRLLNSHPKLVISFEFKSCPSQACDPKEYLSKLRSNWLHRRIIHFNYRSNRWTKSFQSAVFLNRFRRAVRQQRHRPVDATVIYNILIDLFPWAQAVGDKFPGYVFELDQFAQNTIADPIVIYRDVRDVARSHIEQTKTLESRRRNSTPLRSKEVSDIASKWVEAIEAMERNRERVLPLRYEELVTDPQQSAITMGDWLDVDPSLFDTRIIRATSIGRHRGVFSTQQLDEILAVAEPTMRGLDYL